MNLNFQGLEQALKERLINTKITSINGAVSTMTSTLRELVEGSDWDTKDFLVDSQNKSYIILYKQEKIGEIKLSRKKGESHGRYPYEWYDWTIVGVSVTFQYEDLETQLKAIDEKIELSLQKENYINDMAAKTIEWLMAECKLTKEDAKQVLGKAHRKLQLNY